MSADVLLFFSLSYTDVNKCSQLTHVYYGMDGVEVAQVVCVLWKSVYFVHIYVQCGLTDTRSVFFAVLDFQYVSCISVELCKKARTLKFILCECLFRKQPYFHLSDIATLN